MQAAVGGTFFTGAIIDYAGVTAPTGWVILNGTSIGNAASGATGRANADTANLYALLWDNYPDSSCPVSGGRGANAAADFAANKTLNLLDATGRVLVPLGGSPFDVIGAFTGEVTHTLDITEIPSHYHEVLNANGSSFNVTTTVVQAGGDSDTIYASSTSSQLKTTEQGGGGSHNNIQPSLVIGCKIIKL